MNRSVLMGLLSGPILAGLILLIPLGVLTGLNVALDPSLAIDEFAPEEELILPFILFAGIISAANARLAWVMADEAETGQIFKLKTERYLDDPSGDLHAHGHRGRRLAIEFKEFLMAREGADLVCGDPVEEDYGWKFPVGRKDFSSLWILIAQVRNPEDDLPHDEYDITVSLEPPLLPWNRLTFKPDFSLRRQMESQLADFLRGNDLQFLLDPEKWVDPEPGKNPGPMF